MVSGYDDDADDDDDDYACRYNTCIVNIMWTIRGIGRMTTLLILVIICLASRPTSQH